MWQQTCHQWLREVGEDIRETLPLVSDIHATSKVHVFIPEKTKFPERAEFPASDIHRHSVSRSDLLRDMYNEEIISVTQMFASLCISQRVSEEVLQFSSSMDGYLKLFCALWLPFLESFDLEQKLFAKGLYFISWHRWCLLTYTKELKVRCKLPILNAS